MKPAEKISLMICLDPNSKVNDPAAKKFHEKIIRHLKGIIKAWEEWLIEEQKT